MFLKNLVMKSKSVKTLMLLLILVMVVCCRRVEVPPIIFPDTIEVRLDELVNLKVPSYEFKDVYERTVKKIEDKKLLDFSQCVPIEPQIRYPSNYQYHIKEKIHHPKVIDNIEDIKYGNSLIDIFQRDKHLYVITTNGFLLHFGLDINIQSIISEEKISTGFDRLQYGNFFMNNQQICFANGQHVFVFNTDNKTITVLDNYHPLQVQNLDDQFQLAITLTDRYFATLFSQSGIIIYERDPADAKKLKEVVRLTRQSFKSTSVMEFTDLEYDQSRNLLFVADRQAGIFSFKIQATSTSFNATLLSDKINVEDCELIYFHNNKLFMSCSGLVKVDISNWPRVTIENIIDSNIKIKEMIQGDNILIATGSNIIEVFYNNRLIQYVSDHGIDKFLLIGNKYISANEGIIIFGKYQLIPGSLSCQFKSPDKVGIHSLVVTTQAECDQKFIKQANPTWRHNYSPQDTCLYSVYITLQVWKPGKLSILVLAFSIALVIVIVWGLLMWWCVNKFKLEILNNQLMKYVGIANSSRSQPHVQLVEEAQEGTLNQEKQKNSQIQQFENKKQMHAIE